MTEFLTVNCEIDFLVLNYFTIILLLFLNLILSTSDLINCLPIFVTELLIKIAMDKTIVGNNAGKVWYALKEIGEISIPELARRLNLSVESTALAAGWLARENKICIQRKNGLIALSDESAFPFSFG